MSKNILLAGGTGMIGSRLAQLLRERGYNVRLLSRRPRGPEQFAWDPIEGHIDLTAFEGGLKALVNLTGENIAGGRWTSSRRRRILESRVKSAQFLGEVIEDSGRRPEVYLSASAIGFYGNSGERRMSESDAPVDNGFMVEVCQAWEAAARTAGEDCRTVIFRIGIVLSREGGALPLIALPLHLRIGSYFGDGRSWWSWVHVDDVCRAFLWAIEQPQAEGVYNLVAPNPARNKAFVATLARAMRKRALLAPVPAFGLRLALGDMADTVLNSNLIADQKLRAAGFEFSQPDLEAALRDLYA